MNAPLPPDQGAPVQGAEQPADRREFITKLAAAAGALAVTACAPATAQQQPAPQGTPALPPPTGPAVSPQWSDAWARRLTAPYRAVFDAPDFADGTIVTNAYVYMLSLRQVYNAPDSDIQAVLVIRHAAIPMAFEDAFWAKYEIGRHAEVRDPQTGEWAVRNPWLRNRPGDRDVVQGLSLEDLRARGATLIGCNLAAMRMAGRIAQRTGKPVAEVRQELLASLIPGLELAHSGVFAVHRAQQAGCTYMRST